MMNRFALCLLLVGLSVAAAASESSRKEGAQAVIRRLRREFVIAANAGEIDRLAAFLAGDAVLLVDNRKALEGLAAIRESLQRTLDSGVVSELAMETTRVEHSGSLAYELGRFSHSFLQKDGSKKHMHGRYVDVWRRQPGGAWRIVVHAPSSDPAEEDREDH